MTRINSFEELEELRQRILSERDPEAPYITVCAGTGCLASGSREVVAAFHREIEAQGLGVGLGFRSTGCHGFCERGPIVVIDPEEI
jgi:NADH:ubiquinone oxidoreductase subunit E